jgi:hypothetical protein
MFAQRESLAHRFKQSLGARPVPGKRQPDDELLSVRVGCGRCSRNRFRSAVASRPFYEVASVDPVPRRQMAPKDSLGKSLAFSVRSNGETTEV